MTAPLVSVVTASFNQARWLGANLASVARQSYPHIEHIVMDGASTDGSVELLERAGGRVRWRSERDRGQSHALNKALAEARGEIVGWLNSDDAYFDGKAVGAAVNLFERRPDVEVVYGHAALVNGAGLVLQLIWVPPFDYRLLRLHNFIVQPSVFIRRSALADGFLDESYEYAMDRELWLRLGAHRRFARLDHVVGVDRHHPARKSYAGDQVWKADRDRLAALYEARPPEERRVRVKALKIAMRLAGVRLLPRASETLAFGGFVDSRWRLALRQVAVPRRAMPAGASG